MAEGPALEKQYPAKSGIVGSNPTLSATGVAYFTIEKRLWFRIEYATLFMFRPESAYTCKNGEMSELAEGARLEIVCAVTSGTEGSNPSLSATNQACSPLFKASG